MPSTPLPFLASLRRAPLEVSCSASHSSHSSRERNVRTGRSGLTPPDDMRRKGATRGACAPLLSLEQPDQLAPDGSLRVLRRVVVDVVAREVAADRRGVIGADLDRVELREQATV